MKKFLVATTALVAVASVASVAQAADPIKLSLGGFAEAWVGYADQDTRNGATNRAKVLVQQDTEVYFRGATKLDNGLTVSVNIDMEADSDYAGTNDDVFVAVSSDSLGKLVIGSTKGASYGLSHTSPDVGIGHNDGDIKNWINEDMASAGSLDNDTLTKSTDGQKIVYLTPNLSGFQGGASFGIVPESSDGVVDLTAAASDMQYNLGVAYNGDLGGVKLGADVNYELIEEGGVTGTTAANEHSIRGGLSLGVAGFTVGGSYIKTNNEVGVKDQDSKGYDFGVSYKTGPYGVSASYMHLEVEDSAAGNAQDDTKKTWMVSGSYDLGAGVVAKTSIFGAKYDDASATAANNTNDNDGFGVVAGLAVSF